MNINILLYQSLTNINVIYTNFVYFLLTKFDSFVSTKENMAVAKWLQASSAQLPISETLYKFKTMVRVPLVPEKLYNFFKMETSIFVMNSEQR